jgi:hypothetical protein
MSTNISKYIQGFLDFLKYNKVDLGKIEDKVRNEFLIKKTFRQAGMPKGYLDSVSEDEFQVKIEQPDDVSQSGSSLNEENDSDDENPHIRDNV